MNFFKFKEHYERLEAKYISPLELNGRKIDINWFSKIGSVRGLESIMQAEGFCGALPGLQRTFPTRAPRLVRYRRSKVKWYGITYFVDNFITYGDIITSSSGINVAVLMEPRHFKPEIYEAADKNAEHLDVILTHDEYILKKYPDKAVYCIAGAACIEDNSIGMNLSGKSKLVSTILSDKGFLEGHMFRHLFAREVISSRQDPTELTALKKVDLYGTGIEGGSADYKSSTLKSYMFSVAIENGISDTYFTEKIMDCFLTGTIPIYRGTKNISDYFDPRGIIGFETMDELKYILENEVSKEKYKEMIPYAKNNLEITKKYMYIDDIMLLTTLEHLDNKGFDISKLIRYY